MTTILVSTEMFLRVLSSLVTSDIRFGGCIVEQRGKNINLYHIWHRLIFYTACGIVLLLELSTCDITHMKKITNAQFSD